MFEYALLPTNTFWFFALLCTCLTYSGLKKGVFALMNKPNPSESTNAAVITALLTVVTGAALALQV